MSQDIERPSFRIPAGESYAPRYLWIAPDPKGACTVSAVRVGDVEADGRRPVFASLVDVYPNVREAIERAQAYAIEHDYPRVFLGSPTAYVEVQLKRPRPAKGGDK